MSFMKKNLALFVFVTVITLIYSCSSEDNPNKEQSSEHPTTKVEDVCSMMDDLIFMKYCYDNFDVNNDGKVSKSEAEAVHKIDMNSRSYSDLKSLKGLSFFPNLVELDCTRTSLASIDVTQNNKLEGIYLGGTNINSINTSKCPMLQELFVWGTNITQLDVSNNFELSVLNLEDLNIRKIELSKCKKLTDLNINNTIITEIDITQNESFEYISFGKDGLFIKIFCQKLPSYYCPIENCGYIFLSNNKELKSKIPFPDQFFRQIMTDNYDLNKDEMIDFEEARKVKSIFLSSDQYGKDFFYLQSLQGIEYFENLTELTIHFNWNNGLKGELSTIDLSKNSKLESILIQNSSISTLDLSKNTKLFYLALEKNDKLTSVNLTKNSELRFLRCSYNNLTSIDLTKNSKLEYLSCSYNNLTSIDLTKNSKLEDLGCSYNNLTSIDLTKNSELRTLYCSYNNLTSIDVSKNTKLVTFQYNPQQNDQTITPVGWND